MGRFLGLGRRACKACAGSGLAGCRHCGGTGQDSSPAAGLRSDDTESRRQTVESLGLSDDIAALLALRGFREKGGPLLEPVFEDVQMALRRIRQRALARAPNIKPGMTVDQLVRLLGPPISAQSGSQILGSYANVMGSASAISRIGASGYWMFRHPAGDYGVVVSGGMVQNVYTFPYV